MAAQTISIAMSNPYGDCDAGDNKIVIDWTSATGGAVSAAICTLFSAAQLLIGPFTVQPVKLKGFLRKFETNPGATKPTDNYDITLLDEEGYDVLGGAGADRDQDNSESIVPSAPIYIDSELTLTIASAGDEKAGQVIIFMTK